MADAMFAVLDVKNQGFLDKTDLSTALSTVDQTKSGSTPVTADEAFTQLDTNGGGKITKQEFADDLKKMLDDINQQKDAAGGTHHAGRHHRMQGMPPPDNSAGLSVDYLTKASSTATNATSKSQLDDLIANFSAIDTDKDNKVSAKEVLAYKQAQQSAQQSTVSTTSKNEAADLKMLRMIMQITNSYGSATTPTTAQSSGISVTA
jgi:Ca2+-binding EF-hand superfamily protein